jgi:hypothetical protein
MRRCAATRSGRIGEAGPGPSCGDPLEDRRRAGFDCEFTQRNRTIMTWNLMHLAAMLDAVGGYPNEGNDRSVGRPDAGTITKTRNIGPEGGRNSGVATTRALGGHR